MATAERKRELSLGPIPPWQTIITVDALSTSHGRHSTVPQDWVFEVGAEWFGPPAIGMPAARGFVQSRDAYIVPGLEQAKALARYAAAVFGRGGDQPPDLRELADELRPHQ